MEWVLLAGLPRLVVDHSSQNALIAKRLKTAEMHCTVQLTAVS